MDTLLTQLGQQARLVLQAPPGAGKSTRVPQRILQSIPAMRVLMLEPRKLAAASVAQTLATILGEPLGQAVGLISSERRVVSADTRLTVVTEAVLTRMLQDDPMLDGIDLVIFDEFHERSIHADLGLSLCLDVQEGFRPELKLLVMSATLDDSALSAFLDCPVVKSEGRLHPLTFEYVPVMSQHQHPYLASWLVALTHRLQVWIADAAVDDSALVFLPGRYEINQMIRQLQPAAEQAGIGLFALHGAASKSEQAAAIAAPSQGRAIVCATNVAETSLTIDGITTVFDSLRKRATAYNSKSDHQQLVDRLISQAESTQRAGRAGRTRAGHVVRVGTEEQWLRLDAFSTPQIAQSSLTDLVIECLRWGAPPASLQWLTPPPTGEVSRVMSKLDELGVVNSSMRINSAFGASGHFRVDLALFQMTVRQHLQWRPALAAFAAGWQWKGYRGDSSIENQLLSMSRQTEFKRYYRNWSRRLGCGELDLTGLERVLCYAFYDRITTSRGKGLLMSCGVGTTWRYDAHLLPKAMVAVELGAQSEVVAYQPIDLEQLLADESDWVDDITVAELDEQTGRFTLWHKRCLGHLVLNKTAKNQTIEPQMRAEAFMGWLQKRGLQQLQNAALTQWVNRLAIFHQTSPDEQYQVLLQTLDQWAASALEGCHRLEQVRALPWAALHRQSLDWQLQQSIDHQLPSQFVAPTGTKVAIDYTDSGQALAAVRIQEVFGLAETPAFMHGTVPLILELLSPGRRPLQRTADLAGFWAGSYHDVKKEMKGRYPKHPWPDDPASSTATKLTKKRMAQEKP
ncbi:MAG: ATP-dependent helicase HrpB [Gammaproteobacteria bacterium]|nr:ATP-dependent helicase HrpB [Gammaproteobacteria bacterium]